MFQDTDFWLPRENMLVEPLYVIIKGEEFLDHFGKSCILKVEMFHSVIYNEKHEFNSQYVSMAFLLINSRYSLVLPRSGYRKIYTTVFSYIK